MCSEDKKYYVQTFSGLVVLPLSLSGISHCLFVVALQPLQLCLGHLQKTRRMENVWCKAVGFIRSTLNVCVWLESGLASVTRK